MGFKPIQGDYIPKPTGAAANDLLAFIGTDWDKVQKAWAAGDIPYLSGTGWERLPKGSNGQVLQLASGLPSWANKSKDLFFARYGFTYFNVETFAELDTPIKIIDDATQYNSVSAAIVVKDWGNYFNLIKAMNLGHVYINPYFSWETEIRAGDSAVTVTASLRFDATITTSYNHLGTTYTVYGGIAELVGSPTAISNSQKLRLYVGTSNTDYTASSKNNKIWLTHGQKCSTLPSIITTSWINANNFSGIKYIELYDNGDSVKINNDANLIFTGSAGQPVTLNLSTTGILWDNENDYNSITQVEIVSGNPLIVFEKA